MKKPKVEDLFYHPENLGHGKTWRDVQTNNWYYTFELLKEHTLESLSERDARVLLEQISRNI